MCLVRIFVPHAYIILRITELVKRKSTIFRTLVIFHKTGGKSCMFFTVFENLCKSKGKSATAIGSELGISKTTISYWRNTEGVIPKQEVLVKIAKHFDVTVDYLLGNEKENPTADSDEALMFALWGGDTANVTPKMLSKVKEFAQFVQEEERRKKNDTN